MMKKRKFKKVLILGSGAIKIGEAGEFDYSGSQAIKALKEEEVKTILVNPNIATVQTSEYLANKIYFLPVDAYFVEKIIEKERPEGILLGFGGQTALNVGVELFTRDIFKKYKVEVLGTSVEAIQNTEDRELFKKKLQEIDLKTPLSSSVANVEEALKAAEQIGYPIMCRIAYALGGLGSGIAHSREQLEKIAEKAFSFTKQILIEKCLYGWKEIEYEVVRDGYNNCITVCSMENVDPMGIHTGESIVIAPVQTLTAAENFKLRSIAIKLIRHLGIIGECNVQFALNPKSQNYRIIEVNARLSRSSALASKATGYPLAFIAAKLALGYSLTELDNIITRETSACFEPALDYIVLKYPRWDLQKFKKVSSNINTEMKSVGEIMAIGRSYEEVLQKAIRMLDIGIDGLVGNNLKFKDLNTELKEPTDKRMFAIVEAIKRGYSIEKIYQLSKVDPWFLYKMRNIVEIERKLQQYQIKELPENLLKEAKQKGFSDIQIAMLTQTDELAVREKRKKLGIVPYVKQIDTLAAEYPAKTNYLYLTYNGCKDDFNFKDKKQVIVLGGGAYKIGSSVEFDWCCVNSVKTLKDLKYNAIMVNYNPETVSTDYDICDKLYFDELTFERVWDIYEKENPLGIIISMGGQIPNNLALKFHKMGVKILGTNPVNIDIAEDRHKFSQLLDNLNIDQPIWEELTSLEEAEKFANRVGYPVMIRSSYILSGAAMSIALNKRELKKYLKKASDISPERPVVISKFIVKAKEIEIDAVANKGEVYCYAISEHIENAGVHSGDATIVLPPQRTYLETMRKIKIITQKIAKSLSINGPFNLQFIAKDNEIKVIECNLRASRSFPFVSKVLKINFIDLATKIIMGKNMPKINISPFDLDYVGVKAPQFSFTRLKGSDPVLGVEMVSTGEVACLGDDFNEAFLKSLISVGFKMPKKTVLLSTGPIDSKAEFLESSKILEKMGFKLYATKGTADFMRANNIKAKVLYWPLENKKPNTLNYIADKKIDLVINIPKNAQKEELDNDYFIRRKAVDFNIPLITNIKLAKRLVEALNNAELKDLKVKSWDEYN
ncbi:MAG: carbamoyl phosphate synthase large subunit [Candidatus Infernicultor aquiphilus]|uniref:Carbamoyl phosphate synthase large subunit n=2 Tax=Candidatus Infernicultor aquiphilus TaxID=1805029 RepID=A0A2M7KAJ2_9BACT|nr:MAG: carbamoyl phosphate synthase large subunit [Candidatus Atribacteria bacterium CG08_land_8_20_14_0_20_33_29]PIX35150.1 MAG: carbamoyl phosphate synthase large subunit [Candidatus Atribacteria bacterium CG_4_8_14_3_um_filter_34_18]